MSCGGGSHIWALKPLWLALDVFVAEGPAKPGTRTKWAAALQRCWVVAPTDTAASAVAWCGCVLAKRFQDQAQSVLDRTSA